MNNLLTYEQLAERLGMKLTTLRTLVHRGKVPHVRISDRMVRFDEAAIEAAWPRAAGKELV